MSNQHGRPVYGTLHAATLTTSQLVVMFEQGIATGGGASSITAAAGERLVITEVWFISNTASDIHAYLSDDNDATVETGETVLRGTVAANQHMSQRYEGRCGSLGADLRVSSSVSAVVDIGFTGYLVTV